MPRPEMSASVEMSLSPWDVGVMSIITGYPVPEIEDLMEGYLK